MMSFAYLVSDAKKYTDAGLRFLEYLQVNWLDETLWFSWSQHGQNIAASQLKQPVEGVIPTTNHLKFFNAILKQKYITQWQNAGNWLRFISKSCELQVFSVAAQVCIGLHSHYTLSSVGFRCLHRPVQPTAAKNEVC